MVIALIIIIVSAIVAIAIVLGFHAGWWNTNRQYGDPYNWRVCFGPIVYFRWLDRQNDQKELDEL